MGKVTLIKKKKGRGVVRRGRGVVGKGREGVRIIMQMTGEGRPFQMVEFNF